MQKLILVFNILLLTFSAPLASTTIRLGSPIFPNAQNVFLVGEFNNWSTNTHKMTFNGGWSINVEVDRTTKQQYKFIVDGRWTLDDSAPKEGDGKGNTNNVLLPIPPASSTIIVTSSTTQSITETISKTGTSTTSLSTPTPTSGSIFQLGNPRSENARNVFLAGDFNGWSATANRMTKINNQWTITLSLDTSKSYQYKYVIDGIWTLDSAARQQDDGKGNINNVYLQETFPPFPYQLPASNCATFDNYDKCISNEITYPETVNRRSWQTPPRNGTGYVTTYQDYSDLTGYASIEYAADHKSATVTVHTFTKNTNAHVLYSFNGEKATNINKFHVPSDFKEALKIKATIANTVTSLELDPLNFLWQNTPVNKFDGKKGAIVELFGWPYNDIAKECEFLGKAGYMGVKIWPANEHITTDKYLQDGELNNWYFVYQPVSFKLHSRFGTRDELRSMIETCRSNGVRVFADAAFNQMTGGGNDILEHRKLNKESTCSSWGGKEGTAGSPFFTHSNTYKISEFSNQRPALEYPAVPFFPHDFHCERMLGDGGPANQWTDPFLLQYGWLVGMADLNTGSEYVQNRIVDYLIDILSIGFSGFRLDAAKHVSPKELAIIFGKFKKKLGGKLPPDFFTWLEVLMDGDGDKFLACYPGTYNYFLSFNDLLRENGFTNEDIEQIKFFSSDYPKNFPICGSYIIPQSRLLVQNDDHDNQFGNGRDLGVNKGSILVKEKDINKHRQFEIELFKRKEDFKIRNILSSYTFADNGAKGFPDGLSDCKRYKGTLPCKTVPYTPAYISDSCGYSVIFDGKFTGTKYTRTHRDLSIIYAMREWMGLSKVNTFDLGLPVHCT
ncbi:hypothetical protein HDU92_003667 [Lobulomyces angularis]|nr:hypothetical protein HDU92_003667 [Lobulomyces angularis]